MRRTFLIPIACAALAACTTAVEPEPTGPPPYLTISGGAVKPPVAIERVIPERPAGVTETGRVLLMAVIGLDGIPRDIEVLEAPNPKLGEVSVEAAKKWKFKPGTLHGRDVETKFPISIMFH